MGRVRVQWSGFKERQAIVCNGGWVDQGKRATCELMIGGVEKERRQRGKNGQAGAIPITVFL